MGDGISDRQRTDPAPSTATDAGAKATPDTVTPASTLDAAVEKSAAVLGRARRDAQRLASAEISGFNGPKPFSLQEHLYPADRLFNSEKPTLGDEASAVLLDEMIKYAQSVRLDEAAANAARFLSKSGKNRVVDVKRMLRNDVNVAHRVLYDSQEDVDDLLASEDAFPGPGDQPYREIRVAFEPFPFTDFLQNDLTGHMDSDEYTTKKRLFPEIDDDDEGVDRDYFWGYGEVYLRRAVRVAVDPPDEDGNRRVAIEIKVTVYDRYDWVQNDGKKVITDAGIPLKDALFMDLHATGLARNFDIEGSHTIRLTRTIPSVVSLPVEGEVPAMSHVDWFINGFRTAVGRSPLVKQ